jgi:hypothetical protein
MECHLLTFKAKKVKAESEEQIYEAVHKYSSQFGKESEEVFDKLIPYIHVRSSKMFDL